jgi:acetylornithine/succinyldiaminopimelate/putrescine aminotransferase
MRRGLLINCTHDSTLRFLPPFLVTRAQVQKFLGLLEKSFVTTPRKAAASEPANSAPPSHAALAAAR